MIKNAESKINDLLKTNKVLEDKLQIYIPKKYDKVDMALALSLNTFTERDKMKIMFLRESEGVYQFGQKRVYIKIEHGDQPFIRVGGGYMHVREFIDQYTQGELDKIERKNVIKRFLNKI